jgi:hypothetical protein
MEGTFFPLDKYYNIEPEDEYDDCYKSSADLSMNTFDMESEAIAPLLNETIGSYLHAEGIPPIDDALQEVFGRDAIGAFPHDRSMWFFLGNPVAITPRLVHTLQEGVLGKFPLWRLVAQYEEKKIGIYPGYLWIDGSPVVGQLSRENAAYVCWLQEAMQNKESKYGPLVRQLRYLRRILPAAFEEARRQQFIVVATFDRLFLSKGRHVAWVLHTLKRTGLRVNTDSSPMHTFAVAQDATLFPEFCPDFAPRTGNQPDFWLAAYFVPPEQRSLIATMNGATVAQSRVKPVVSDESLRVGDATS